MSAELVKKLREITGAGIVDCMNAIKENKGDIDKAVEWLHEKGVAKAAKKAGAIAAEGVVSIVSSGKVVVIFEVNSQTDFVASNEIFSSLVSKIGDLLLKNNFKNIDEANEITSLKDKKSISDLCIDATAKIGEKIVLRRAEKIILNSNESLGAYVHVNKRIAAIFIAQGGNDEIAKNVAMHVASMNPQFLDEQSVPKNQIDNFKNEIQNSDAIKTPSFISKPENIKMNILNGMLKKKLSEITLVDQEFVMEKMLVSKYLDNFKAIAKKMVRFEVGEGIEKIETNFADEVKAQMKK